MINIDCKTPSHYCAAHGFASRIDRIYVGLPAWVMPCLATKSVTCADPRDWNIKNISDHVPISVELRARKEMPKMEQPIPSWIAKSPEFKKAVDDLCDAVKMEIMSTIEKWRFIKMVIREASTIARGKIVENTDKGTSGYSATLTTIARLVWFGGTRRFRMLSKRSTLIAEHVMECEGRLYLKEPEMFAKLIETDKWDHARKEEIKEGVTNGPQKDHKREDTGKDSRIWRNCGRLSTKR